MRAHHVFASIAVFFALQGCSPESATSGADSERPESWQHHLKPLESKELAAYPLKARAYVPVYSHIYTENRQRVLNLAETVSVRNTDDSNPIVVTSVKYQSSAGKLIREYVQSPVLLEPMATADFVVRLDDTSGGSGASFLVDWQSAKAANQPLIEAIMISTGSGRNLSFVSRAILLPPGKVKTATEESKSKAGEKTEETGKPAVK